MKILIVNPSQSKLPVRDDLIRADTYISIPLAQELAKRGHNVSFLTSKDSSLDIPQIKTNLDAMFSVIPIEEFYAVKDLELSIEFTKSFYANILFKCQEIARSENFDIIHIHSNYFLLELSLLDSIKNIPIVVTLHSTTTSKELFSKFISQFDLTNKFFLSISNKQRESFPYQFIDTVYNGVDINNFAFEKNGGKTLLFSGRLRKIKGIIEALKVSVETNKKLQFVGKTNGENEFVKNEIIPFTRQYPHLISHLGQVNRSTIPTFYQNGKVTLFPILWEEPFGLVQIESMSCGTPVIAYAHGSVPEVIKDGETGYIINSSYDDIRGNWIIKKTGIDGLCEAVERIYSMPQEQYREMRKACRAHVEKNFTVERMVDEYEKVYEQILSSNINK